MVAEAAHQTLGQESPYRSSHQEWLHAHINQSANTTNCVVGVQGRKYQVTSQGCTNGNLRCFKISNLTQHYDIRVGSKNGTKSTRKSKTDLTLHRDLHHSFKLILHRILNRHDPGIGGIEFAQEGIERRRFTGTSRTGDQNNSVG